MKLDNPATIYALAQSAFASGSYRTATMHADLTAGMLAKRDYSIRRSSAEDVRHSIVLVTYKHSDGVLLMLEHLRRYSNMPGYELILVNNGNNHIQAIVDHLELDCTLVESGFNYGCSGGRNLGATYARGDVVVFVDDDGVLVEGAIEALCACISDYDALAVRGRVVPLTNPKFTAAHYDKGDKVIPAVPDAEGISVWRRSTFLEFGGFDVLLYGHEGLRLMCKMYPMHGPNSFLYCPEAVLKHDYHGGGNHLADKESRYKSNREYLDHHGHKWRELSQSMRTYGTARETQASFINSKRFLARQKCEGLPPVSLLTTSWNGAQFLKEFSASLRQQTHQDFEIIFVDDGSTDDTAEAIKSIWQSDARLRYIRTNHIGRAAALTTALESATNDICAIADVDDLSVPRRLEWTCRYFAEHPRHGCVSFFCFNEETCVRLARPFPIELASIKARMLTGMPVSFPSFAFRKSLFRQPFDHTLTAGIDCDWLFRNLKSAPVDGHVIPLPGTYYRLHEGQITTPQRDVQRSQALRCVADLHSDLLPQPLQNPKIVEQLTGWTPIESGAELKPILEYVHDLMGTLDAYSGCSPREARLHLETTYLGLQERRVRGDYGKLKEAKERVDSQLKEAVALSRGPLSSAQRSVSEAADTLCKTDYGVLGFRHLFYPFGLAAVAMLGNKRDRERFAKNPAAFFDGLKNKRQRSTGLFFFPIDKR